MSMEISGTSNTYFVGTDVSPYGCSRDGMAAVPYTAELPTINYELSVVLCLGWLRM